MNDFYYYLTKHGLSEGTASGYNASIASTFSKLLEKGVVSKHFDSMSASEVKTEIPRILADETFKEMDVSGHKLRSNGLKWYLKFLQENK